MKKSTRKLTLLLYTLPFLLLCGCGKEAKPEPQKESTPVEVALVEKGSISAENSISGQVAAGEQQSVFVATSARCTAVHVEVGDTVSAGQTICTLDTASIWANYETASMNYKNTQQSYAEQSSLLSQQVAQAEKNVTDTQALFDIGAASQMEVDNAKLALENAKVGMSSALRQLEVGMQSNKATMEQLQSSLANIDRSGNVTAPIAGTILSLSASENNFVAPSAPVATIESTGDMEIVAGVSESLVAKLQVGGRVSISIDSVKKSFDAAIASIENAANQGNHLYGVSIKVPAAQASGLRSGMFADVVFYTDTQQQVIIIPTEAIQTGLQGSYVYVVDDKNIAHMVSLQTGLVGDGITEVTDGLSVGDTLVTVGQSYLSDGDEIRIVSAEV